MTETKSVLALVGLILLGTASCSSSVRPDDEASDSDSGQDLNASFDVTLDSDSGQGDIEGPDLTDDGEDDLSVPDASDATYDSTDQTGSLEDSTGEDQGEQSPDAALSDAADASTDAGAADAGSADGAIDATDLVSTIDADLDFSRQADLLDTRDDPMPDLAEDIGPVFHSLNLSTSGTGNGVIRFAGGDSAFVRQCGAGGDDCERSYLEGTNLQVEAYAIGGSRFVQWTDGPCTGTDPNCAFALGGDVSLQAEFEMFGNLIVIAPTGPAGTWGAAANTDAICNSVLGGLGYHGAFIAWVSDANSDAIDRLASYSPNGWYRYDGLVFSESLDELDSHGVIHPVLYTASGERATKAIPTGTLFNGRSQGPAAQDCSDWTSLSGVPYSGSPVHTSNWWTVNGGGTTSCGTAGQVYCLQVDSTEPIEAETREGLLAFPSSASWAPGGGVDGASALCQSEADAADIEGTF
ncbi:MAG: hypothetical protein KC561_06525, partial [Myxococcales bacterium]|nr:hypothetical protein [Myxococcales bacterium]